MKMFLYYAGHTFVNQIKKIFKTWVAVFILVCIVMGAAVGFGAGFLSDMAEKNETAGMEDVSGPKDEQSVPEDPERTRAVLEFVVGAATLAMFLYNILSGDKNGSNIFMMADVNLLFPSPMKPQSVLLFRLVMQMGAAIAASIYLVFQIPNLVLNVGLSVMTAVALMFAWILMLVISKLLSVLTYSVASTRPGLKRYVRPFVYAILVVIAAGYLMKWRGGGLAPFDAATAFFNGHVTWYIPLWGWLKGFAMSAADGHIGAMLLYLAAIVAASAALTYLIWSLKVDFYEDAMGKSAEKAEALAAAQTEGTAATRRKKDRSDSIRRDGLNRGWGASVFFWKSMYNRFRFAAFGVFTKTMVTYLLIGAAAVVLFKYVLHTEGFLFAALAFGAMAFFRSLGNSLGSDTHQDVFLMSPDSAYKKVFFSLMSGTANSALDILPGYILAAAFLGAAPMFAAAAFLLIISVDLYSSTVSTFIDMSLSVSLSKIVNTLIQMLFIYFGLIPLAGLLGYGIVTGQAELFMLLATLFDLIIAGVMFLLTPRYLINGRK